MPVFCHLALSLCHCQQSLLPSSVVLLHFGIFFILVTCYLSALHRGCKAIRAPFSFGTVNWESLFSTMFIGSGCQRWLLYYWRRGFCQLLYSCTLKHLLSIAGPSSVQLLGKLRLVNCSMIKRLGVCGGLIHIMILKLFSKSSETYVFSEMIMIRTPYICIRVCRLLSSYSCASLLKSVVKYPPYTQYTHTNYVKIMQCNIIWLYTNSVGLLPEYSFLFFSEYLIQDFFCIILVLHYDCIWIIHS